MYDVHYNVGPLHVNETFISIRQMAAVHFKERHRNIRPNRIQYDDANSEVKKKIKKLKQEACSPRNRRR